MKTALPPTPSHNANNFDFLRVLAAALVIYSHSFPLLGQSENILRGVRGMSWGTVAVGMFFVISGYLITASRAASPSTLNYLIKRALRILPALWVSVLFCIFLVGPLVTSLPLAEYFSEHKTWSFMRNMLPYNIAYFLPGVFTGNPNTGVNGVYWTLPIEILCYLIVAGFALLRGLRAPYIAAFALLLFAIHLFTRQAGSGFLGGTHYYITLFGGQFFLGAALYLCRDKIPLRAEIFFMMLLFSAAMLGFPKGKLVLFLTLPYMVVYLAHAPLPFKNFGKYGDFSYGLYLYGFPIQQLIVWKFGTGISPYILFFSALTGTLLCAFASWHCVEKPALGLKQKLIK